MIPTWQPQRFEAAGFTDQDGDGWRDLPSGKSFQLILDSGDWGGQVISENSNIELKEQMNAIGIDAIVNDLFGQPEWAQPPNRRQVHVPQLPCLRAGHLDLSGLDFPAARQPRLAASGQVASDWWRRGAKSRCRAVPQPSSRPCMTRASPPATRKNGIRVVWEAVQIHIDEGPFTLGGAGDQPMPVVIKNNFKNVPTFGILGPWAPGSPGNVHPEQFYIEQ